MDTTGVARRRNRLWPESLKREIVEASLAPGASVSVDQFDATIEIELPTRYRVRVGAGVAGAVLRRMLDGRKGVGVIIEGSMV